MLCLAGEMLVTGVNADPVETIGRMYPSACVDTVVLHPDPLFKANISIPKLLGTSSVNLIEKDFGCMDLLCPRLHPLPGDTPQSVTG